MAARCTPAFRSCAASKMAKPNGYAPASWPERLSSATAANGFAALPSNGTSSMNATSPAPIAELHATLPSAGQTPCSPIPRTACSPPTEWSPPNICRATSAPSLGGSTDALSSKHALYHPGCFGNPRLSRRGTKSSSPSPSSEESAANSVQTSPAWRLPGQAEDASGQRTPFEPRTAVTRRGPQRNPPQVP